MAGPVVSIGNFDGVHLGHQAILARARARADAPGGGGRVVALTFEPHPAVVLRPERAPARLCPWPQRVAWLRRHGADAVELIEPTPALLDMTPQAFVEHLVQRHRPSVLVEGPDFRFGKGRAGDVAMLATLGARHGFDVQVVEPVRLGLSDCLMVQVSSSLIRWLLEQGRVADVARCLGRPFELTGVVSRGEQRGRLLGVPTINLAAPSEDDAAGATAGALPALLPGDGVYAGYAKIHAADAPTLAARWLGSPAEVETADEGAWHPAAISIGVKPSFAGAGRVVEAHLLDFSADVYNRVASLRFTHWLRGQQPFPGVADLRAQLGRDLGEARRLLAG